MILNITDPAIMFPGISLLFLAYTNRYLSLASVIRALNKDIKSNEEHHINTAQQIQKLNLRIRLIKYMQAFGVLAFLFCVFSMLMLMWELQLIGKIFFVASLLAMTISLILSLTEILKSEQSLRIELDRTRIRDQWKKD